MTAAESTLKVMVTGASGQLGSAIRDLSADYPNASFDFLSKDRLSITDEWALNEYLKKNKPDWCINTAAYTLVDKAEAEKEQAFSVNGIAVGTLAGLCKKNGTKFIHISTDYVFDGKGSCPYKEDDPIHPINTYGASKAEGERLVREQYPEGSWIIRTSWVYGHQGNNFVKTMRRLMGERDQLGVVSDQQGCPTNAADLALAIMKIVFSQRPVPAGIYHFSNTGVTTWYEFACTIKEMTGASCLINPVPTTSYPTPAVRPAYSVMDTSKISKALGMEIPLWKDSLRRYLAET